MKLKYTIDPFNRLIAYGGGEAGVSRFRHVIDGTFRAGPRNALIYHIKAPSKPIAGRLGLPYQVKLTGRWSLTKDHDLKLTFDKWKRVGDSMTLSGTIVGARSDSLLFAVSTRTSGAKTFVRTLKLEGSWQADRRSRLIFRAKKEKGAYDTLRLDGIWEIDRKHQIIYRGGKDGHGRRSVIVFKGFWDIAKRHRIAYVLDYKKKSVFDFRGRLLKLDGRWIKYEIGIGVSGREKPVKRQVALFGRWRVDRRRGLSFEYRTEGGKFAAIKFGADVKLSSGDTAAFMLTNRAREGLGLTLKLSRRLLNGDGEAFLRFLNSKKETAIYLGAGWKW